MLSSCCNLLYSFVIYLTLIAYKTRRTELIKYKAQRTELIMFKARKTTKQEGKKKQFYIVKNHKYFLFKIFQTKWIEWMIKLLNEKWKKKITKKIKISFVEFSFLQNFVQQFCIFHSNFSLLLIMKKTKNCL